MIKLVLVSFDMVSTKYFLADINVFTKWEGKVVITIQIVVEYKTDIMTEGLM